MSENETEADPTVGVVIVSYNTADWLQRCLGSISAASASHACDVIVVDNASSDGSGDIVADQFPGVVLHLNAENLGFARAVNQGVAHLATDYVLLLNPDGFLRPGAIDELLDFAERNPQYVICGGRTQSPDGAPDPRSCWKTPSLWSVLSNALLLSSVFRGSALFDPEAMGHYARDSVRTVDIVSGCLLLIRRNDWRSLGGFDERFFMYAEDADLCLRATADGRHCAITPAATMVHAVSASSALRTDKLELLFRGRISLIEKHWPRWKARVGVQAMIGGVLVRAVLERLRPRRESAWADLWRRRHDWSRGYPPATHPYKVER